MHGRFSFDLLHNKAVFLSVLTLKATREIVQMEVVEKIDYRLMKCKLALSAPGVNSASRLLFGLGEVQP